MDVAPHVHLVMTERTEAGVAIERDELTAAVQTAAKIAIDVVHGSPYPPFDDEWNVTNTV